MLAVLIQHRAWVRLSWQHCFSDCTVDEGPGLQAAYKDLIRIGSPRSVPILQDTEGMPLLDLPDSVLEEIASLLPASCLAILQVTCHHLNTLLRQDRCIPGSVP